MRIQLSERSCVEYQTLFIQLTIKIVNATIIFILTTERFSCPFFLKLSNSSKSEALQSPP